VYEARARRAGILDGGIDEVRRRGRVDDVPRARLRLVFSVLGFIFTPTGVLWVVGFIFGEGF
jgi:hypothetical protein